MEIIRNILINLILTQLKYSHDVDALRKVMVRFFTDNSNVLLYKSVQSQKNKVLNVLSNAGKYVI